MHPSNLPSCITIICVSLILPSISNPLGSSKINLNSFTGLKNPVRSEPGRKLTNNRIIENINLNYLVRRQLVQNRTTDGYDPAVRENSIRHSSRNRIKGVLILNSKLTNASAAPENDQVSNAIDRIRDILGTNMNHLGGKDAKILSKLQHGILTVLQGIPSLESPKRLYVGEKKGFRLRRSADDSDVDETTGMRRKRFSGYKMFLDKTEKASMLCPYNIEKDINTNRFPKVINRIKCKFENCLCSNKGSFRCTQMWTKYEVQFKGSAVVDEIYVEHSCVCATSQSASANDIELPSGVVS